LQVSSDERQRAARVAELFSEEDLSRHLQIILRTHSELGYRQEQRFHLELGLLKMAHAQRLLPIEQLLSEAVISAPATGRGAAPSAPSVPPPLRRTQDAPRSVSPFSADSARKGGYGRTEMSDTPGPRPVPNPPVIMGSAAPAPVAATESQADPEDVQIAAAVAQPDIAPQDLGVQIAGAVEGAGHSIAASLLSSGSWSFEGAQPVVKVAASEVGIKMTFGPEPVKVANAAASAALGRPAKLKIVSGGQANGPQRSNGAPRAAGSSKSRAAQDPIVKRLQEKFGAEIRTVIDYQDKR
jgi:DNA polymerase-3 subunit gamma/tau